MTAADALFLASDRPGSPQVIGGLVLLTAKPGMDAATAAEWVARVLQERLPQEPVLWETLQHRRPAWLRRPTWQANRPPVAADVESHVLRDDAEVRRHVAALLATPLPPHHRPWGMDVFAVPHGPPRSSGFGADGDRDLDQTGARVTVLFRLHHSFTDGLGVISLTRSLFDEGRKPAREPAIRAPIAPKLARARATLRRQAAAGVSFTRGVAGLAARGSAPAVPWSAARSSQRLLEVVELPLREIQSHAKSLGVGMTALIAAAVGEGVRDLTGVGTATGTTGGAGAGRSKPRRLRAMLPVAVRSAGTWHDLGNHTAGVPLDIPLGPGSLAERARTVQDQLSQAGQEQQARAARLLVAAVPRLLPHAAQRWLVRAVYGPRWFSLIVTALPGPRQQQHIDGHAVRGVGGILPLPPGVALTVGALRWTDTMTVTLFADPAALPDLGPVRTRIAALVSSGTGAEFQQANLERPG